ncbi:hypothetical protein [Lysobacter enzymogenes]|uniref:hypothetical protein n=1 Tax=Lysobacter enzymogenes TaxID=69 RepID=UPI00099C4E55|nr:hypothetical protein [Lysobacter enzymogenes]QQQ01133.1 hypothetical protein JHW41_24295 [Lysobacter enzymogenes]UZW60404.1 hypothetical protein BV903_024620 [Lysobacter enzymogenes]
MKLSTCAALALTLGLSGIAAAADGPSRAANAIAPLYWHCIYQSENGGVYEFVQRGRCALIVNHQTLGQLSLIDAYQA